MVKIAIPLPANMLLVRYLFAWGRDLRSLHAKARAFDFDTAHCTVEADRALIKQSVATACRHSGIVSPNVSDADAIAKLQQNISTLAPTWVEEAMGSTGITLRFAFVTMLPFFAVFLDNFLADARLVFLGNMSRDALLVSLVRTYANLCNVLLPLLMSLHCASREGILGSPADLGCCRGKRIFVLCRFGTYALSNGLPASGDSNF